MGYRSNVEIVIYGPTDRVTAFIAAQRVLGAKWMEYEHDVTAYHRPYKPEEHWTMIHAAYHDVKWYEGYDEVQAWNALMNDVADDDFLNYEYVRVGEEYEDVECEVHGSEREYFIYPSRDIIRDFPQFVEGEQT